MLPGLVLASAGSCGLAELSCLDGHCVAGDAYCNGQDDCGDGSDEPSLCTPCNRTYHGREGHTYRLNISRPSSSQLPFLCHLTFTAGGQGYGELVQLLWEAFSVGRLEPDPSAFVPGCPEGSLELAELNRPFTGGSWCGGFKDSASYYSETSTITASIRLFQAPPTVPFEFSLRYRFVSRGEAVARLGRPEVPLERGSPVPGTYCSRNFYECHQRACRVQSPNYPGEYPRNATCLITLRQKEVPTCKHAMMSVRLSPSGIVGPGRNGSLAVWQDCGPDKDRLIFRDGARTDDPVLLVYCGGPLPRVTSRGPSMLVEFRSSPLAMPLGASTLRVELETRVVYVDSDGLDYARGSQGCHFFVNGTAKRSGVLRAPLHALPPNTNCTWNIRGAPGDRVWVYFSSYFQRDLTGAPENNATVWAPDGSCAVRMTIWDGSYVSGLPIASLCDETPRLCAHAALRNATRATRPCAKAESYVSGASGMTLHLETGPDGTALHTVNFQAHYEFISTQQGGEPWGDGLCSRIWRKVRSGEVTSPRDVRLFGRGGASRIECRYRIEASSGERVRLTLHNVSLGESTTCANEPDPHTGRPRCLPEAGSREARLTLFEAPWRDVRLSRACLCDNTSHLPLTHVSTGRALEVVFLVDQQAPHEDFETLFFYASFELVRAPECPRKQRIRGEGGELRFVAPPLSRPDIYCEGLPWLVEARENRSLFVLTWGWFLPLEPLPTPEGTEGVPRCPTTNRVLLYSGWPPRLLKVVCPAEPGSRDFTVHVFSEEWLGPTSEGRHPGPPRPPALILDFVARESGQAAASWLEISKTRSALRRHLRLPERGPEIEGNESLTHEDCAHKCPELGACISPSLWCDGRVHCPSGHDEAHCGNGARLLGLLPPAMWFMVVGVTGIATVFACLIAILVGRSKTRTKRLHYDGKPCKRPRRAPTEETLLDAAS
ncbi:uncharacterized protein LOC105695127 [Orussus abietinus]|uniref:uncharacterized protein LOC105695127 n=1 Tax=Orussus abietinus TaxID=222816 RepID=UPI0006258A32|nr:uncharacterized protein LOC105695127 [Orussus abietinus]